MADYFKKTYEDETRWHSYYCQIKEVTNLKPVKVLEIGKGSGLVSTVLNSRGISVTTLDIDPDVDPDIEGSVLRIPLESDSYDTILCAEVLEHLPYEDFHRALAEIRRVTKRFAVISLPHWGWMFNLQLKIPMLSKIDLFWKFSGVLKHPPEGDHYWEIGKRGYPFKKIKSSIENAGFDIRNTYFRSASPYHHFFVLEIK